MTFPSEHKLDRLNVLYNTRHQKGNKETKKTQHRFSHTISKKRIRKYIGTNRENSLINQRKRRKTPGNLKISFFHSFIFSLLHKFQRGITHFPIGRNPGKIGKTDANKTYYKFSCIFLFKKRFSKRWKKVGKTINARVFLCYPKSSFSNTHRKMCYSNTCIFKLRVRGRT